MSNSIWKTGDPTYRNNNFDEIIVREYKRWAADGVFYLVDDCTELPNRWAYLLDIIAQVDKAERLQEAVDLALNWLHTIATAHHPTTTYYNLDAQTAIDEIKQLIKGE